MNAEMVQKRDRFQASKVEFTFWNFQRNFFFHLNPVFSNWVNAIKNASYNLLFTLSSISDRSVLVWLVFFSKLSSKHWFHFWWVGP